MTQIKCAMSERLLRLGISMAQLNILYTLRRSGEMPMSRLADVLDVSLSNATGLIDRIEERGFVERTRVPEDRRVVLVRLTAAGVQMLDEHDALDDDLLRTVLGRLEAVPARRRSPRRSPISAPRSRPRPVRRRIATPVSTPAPRSTSTMRGVEGPSRVSRPSQHLAATPRRD